MVRLFLSRSRPGWRGHTPARALDEKMAVAMSHADVQMHHKDDGDEDEQRASRSDRWKKRSSETRFTFSIEV